MRTKWVGVMLSASFSVMGLATGCGQGSVGYGAPTQATGSQQQAVTSLSDVSGKLTLAAGGKIDSENAFNVHSLMGTLQGTALNQSGSTNGLMLEATDLDPACVSGTAATGFTYNNCVVDSGATLSGSVKITPHSVSYDNLKITSGSGGANTELILNGIVTVNPGALSGNLEYKIHIDLGSLGGLAGLSGVNTDVTTTAKWDITYTENPSCITGGTIEVTVDQADKLHGAKFTFTGCKVFTVQNG